MNLRTWPDGTPVTTEFVIGAYQVYHRTRDSIEAHLTIVLAATFGVLSAWAIAGLVLTPVVLRRMARRESGLERHGDLLIAAVRSNKLEHLTFPAGQARGRHRGVLSGPVGDPDGPGGPDRRGPRRAAGRPASPRQPRPASTARR